VDYRIIQIELYEFIQVDTVYIFKGVIYVSYVTQFFTLPKKKKKKKEEEKKEEGRLPFSKSKGKNHI
jgi:hypothetical protein